MSTLDDDLDALGTILLDRAIVSLRHKRGGSISENEKELILEAYAQGSTIKEIVSELGFPYLTVVYLLQEHVVSRSVGGVNSHNKKRRGFVKGTKLGPHSRR